VQRFDEHHPTRTMPAHRHTFFELMYLEEGGGAHRVNGETFAAEAGDLYVIAPGEVHDVADLTPARGWVIVFEAEAIGVPETRASVNVPGELLLLGFLRPPTAARLQVPLARRAFWKDRIGSLCAELSEQQLGASDAARWYLNLLLLEAARLASPHLASLTPTVRPLLTRMFEVVERRFREPLSLADVTLAVGRSRSHLTEVVRRETGRSVLEWITLRRLTEARRLLIETDLSVEAVALEAGFTDRGYFGRRFRQHTRLTPSQWRRRQRA